MHLHILGICGTFMGGLAALARESGHRVTGCDAQVYPPMSEQLRSLGIELIEGYDPGQRALAADCWVIGNAITRGNPLLEALLDAGERLVSGPQWLAEHVLGGRTVLAVAGTHGKTTTASLLAWILQETGQRPGFLIGGVPRDFGVSARLGQGPLFVIEADEYDTAFFDKRSKFVHYRSRVALLNNLEFDHADIFADLAAIETQFHHLVRTLPRQGTVVVNGADPALQRVLERGLWSARVDFGIDSGWHSRQVTETQDATRFELYRGDERQAEVVLPLAGAHNRSNAVAAIATAVCVGVAPAAAAQTLARFGGVRRRLEERGCVRGVTVLDDFAHHPSAIETTVAGLRARIGAQARILAVIEPRSNTMRLGTMKARLPESLAQADRVYCHAAGLDWSAAEVLAPLGDRAWVGDDLEQLVDRVVADARASDRILVMSNRAFGGVHGKLLAALARSAP